MKLLIINYMSLPVPPVKGGAVEYLVNSFLLHNEKEKNHDIVMYSIYDEVAERESKKYTQTTFKFIKIESIADKVSRAVRHLINKYTKFSVGNAYIAKIMHCERKNLNQYDAIIIENAPEFCLRIPESFKGRVILHLHNDFLNAKVKNAKKIFDRCDEIYTISDSLGDCVRTIEKSGKIKTLYNGIDLKRFSFSETTRNAMRKKYNIADDDFVFMFCGRIVPDKGVLSLVEAFGKLEKKDVKLIVAGGIGYSNNDEDAYFRKVKAASCENVIFTGFLPYDKIAELYTVADVGVVPSVSNDSFNLTCIEFCANGCPVIISDRGAMKELVNDKCSLIAKCDEHFAENIHKNLLLMYSRRDGKNELGAEAKAVSEKFSIDDYCKNFNLLLNGVNDSL